MGELKKEYAKKCQLTILWGTWRGGIVAIKCQSHSTWILSLSTYEEI